MANSKSVSFSRPKITGKVVLAQGPSGWLETFKRAELDAQLKAFLTPVSVDDVVSLFLAQRSGPDSDTCWETIVGYLGRLKSVTPFAIPATIGVAFWTQVVASVAAAKQAN